MIELQLLLWAKEMEEVLKIDQCIITLTRSCNLRCDFCYAKGTGYLVDETIGYTNLKKIIEFCSDAKVKYVVFTGGEPAMYPDLKDIIKYVKSRGHKMLVAMATNGILLADYDYCKGLIDSGLDYIDVSLKGGSEKECFETAGQKCLSKQLDAIRNISKFQVDFTCSMVLTHANIGGFCKAVESAYLNGARQFSFTFVLDNEKSEQKDVEYLEMNNPYTLINNFISHIDELDHITRGEWWVEYTFPICVYTEGQLEKLKGKLAAPCQIYRGNGITFDTNMNLLPCSMFIDDKIGQFGVDFSSYEEFRKYAERDPYQSTIKRLGQMPSRDCENCGHLEHCLGGCPVFWKNCSYKALMEFKNQYNDWR